MREEEAALESKVSNHEALMSDLRDLWETAATNTEREELEKMLADTERNEIGDDQLLDAAGQPVCGGSGDFFRRGFPISSCTTAGLRQVSVDRLFAFFRVLLVYGPYTSSTRKNSNKRVTDIVHEDVENRE